MNTFFKIPFYARASLIVTGLYFFINMLYIAQGIIIPVIVAAIIAILLHPVINFFVKRKMNRVLIIVLTLIVAALLVIVPGMLIVSQAVRFSESLPKLADKLYELLNQMITWLSGYLNISKEDINAWLIKAKGDLIKTGSIAIRNTLSGIGSILALFFLIPVYVFMILFYQPLLLDFVYKISGTKNNESTSQILTEIKGTIQSYLVGLLIEMTIIATLNSVGLLILGIPYAIVLGIIGALLNLIPYLGGITAMVIYMIIALVTKDSPLYVLYILLLYTIIQIIDNNLIVPKIVGAKVKLNALLSFIVIIAGGVLWGIVGMFLAIPLTAILKVICDHTESMKPWGFLLGDTMPSLISLKLLFKKKEVLK